MSKKTAECVWVVALRKLYMRERRPLLSSDAVAHRKESVAVTETVRTPESSGRTLPCR